MHRFLLLAILGAWLLWACAAPAVEPAPAVSAGAADTIVVYKSPT